MRKYIITLAATGVLLAGGWGYAFAHDDPNVAPHAHDESAPHIDSYEDNNFNGGDEMEGETAPSVSMGTFTQDGMEFEAFGDGKEVQYTVPVNVQPEDVINLLSDEDLKEIDDHFKAAYGSADGPMAEINAKQEQLAKDKKRIAAYSQTYDERKEMLRQEALQKANLQDSSAAAPAEKAPPQVYIRAAPPTKTPPRLFNNVE